MGDVSAKQQRFTECVGTLIAYAGSRGYGLTFGDAYRDPRVHGKMGDKVGYAAAKSVHKLRLAVDFNLFVEGVYVTDGKHVAYSELGALWERLDENARWGGRFDDANHFSFEHNGVR